MIFLFCTILLFTQSGETLLPRWMTPEEQLRIHEIGRGHEITAPPTGWVETPGEFEEMRGIFITWLYSSSAARPIFREIVREVAEICRVYIIVGSSSEQDSISNYLQLHSIPLDSIEFFTWPRNSIWIRDYGPCFLRQQDNTEGIVDFI
jgi:agmatine/peptidylarginine deiminase